MTPQNSENSRQTALLEKIAGFGAEITALRSEIKHNSEMESVRRQSFEREIKSKVEGLPTEGRVASIENRLESMESDVGEIKDQNRLVTANLLKWAAIVLVGGGSIGGGAKIVGDIVNDQKRTESSNE